MDDEELSQIIKTNVALRAKRLQAIYEGRLDPHTVEESTLAAMGEILNELKGLRQDLDVLHVSLNQRDR